MSAPREAYYSDILTTGGFILLYSLVLGIGGILIAYRGNVDPFALFAGIAAGVVTTLILTILAVAFFPVLIGPEGLRSYNLWGLYVTVAWSDIVGVGTFNLLGLRYLTVRSASGDILFVPLFLGHFQRFCQRVSHLAGPEHPLSRALVENLG